MTRPAAQCIASSRILLHRIRRKYDTRIIIIGIGNIGNSQFMQDADHPRFVPEDSEFREPGNRVYSSTTITEKRHDQVEGVRDGV